MDIQIIQKVHLNMTSIKESDPDALLNLIRFNPWGIGNKSMPRQPRFVLPGQPQHVIQRGNNRQNTFCAESGYLFYLKKLGEAAEKYQCAIHAYVLMRNHVHLLVTPQYETGISKMMQSLGRCYVQERQGHKPSWKKVLSLKDKMSLKKAITTKWVKWST